MNTTQKVIGGFLLGTALGAISGILMAPHSGRKTRKKIMDDSKRIMDKVGHGLTDSLTSLRGNYNEKVEKYAQVGKDSIDHLKEVVKASN